MGRGRINNPSPSPGHPPKFVITGSRPKRERPRGIMRDAGRVTSGARSTGGGIRGTAIPRDRAVTGRGGFIQRNIRASPAGRYARWEGVGFYFQY